MADSPFSDPNFLAFMEKMLGRQQQQAPAGPDLSALLSQIRNDPQGDANRAYVPGHEGPGNPFNNGFFNNSASNLTPEGRMATQGRSAQNQWAQLGQNGGVDPSTLTALMGKMTPIPSGPPLEPLDQYSDPFAAARIDHIRHPVPAQMPQPREVRRATPVGPGELYGQNNPVTLPPGTVAGDGTTNYRRVDQGSQGETGAPGAAGLSGLMPQSQQTDPWSGIKALLGLLHPQPGTKKPVPFGASANPQPGFSF